jgi:SOS-response transcriptional repressor LexA
MTDEMIVVQVAGVVTPGQPLGACNDALQVPAALITKHERVYRVAGDDLRVLGMEPGDLLIVEPRDNDAQTGEVVVVVSGKRVYVGRWWKKHGLREARDAAGAIIARGRGLRIIGAVTLIVRLPDGDPSAVRVEKPV